MNPLYHLESIPECPPFNSSVFETETKYGFSRQSCSVLSILPFSHRTLVTQQVRT
jgi:hypothetical protein